MRTAVMVVLGVLALVGWGVAGGLAAGLATVIDRAADNEAAARSTDGPSRAFTVPLGPDPLGPDPRLEGVLPAGPPVDSYELTVHTDGCGVIRTEGPGGEDLGGLTWVVTDSDGFQVLGRNALGETRYRYYVGGTYDVVLESFAGEGYVEVSNTVTITC